MERRDDETQTAFAIRCIKAEAWDEGHASAHGYDLTYHLDRDEWTEMPKDPANPYRD